MSGGLAFGSGFNAAAAGGAPNPFKPNAAAPAAPAAPNPFAPAAAGGAAKPANPFAPAAAAAPAAGAAPNPFAPPAANGAAAPAAANGFAPTNAGAFAFQPPAATAAGAAAPANPFAPPAAGGAAAANPFKPAAATAGAANPFAPPATAAAQANPFVSTVSPSLLTSANAGDEVAQQLIQVRKSYDRGDPKSRFQLIFYNKANPAIMSRVVRPPQANPRLWEQAIINNPSPTTLGTLSGWQAPLIDLAAWIATSLTVVPGLFSLP